MLILNMLLESNGARPRRDAEAAARLLMTWPPTGVPQSGARVRRAYRHGRQSRFGGGVKAVSQNMRSGLADVFLYKTL